MNQNQKKLNAVMALLAVVASGCGGGGGDSSPVAAGAPVVAPAPAVSTPVAPPAPVVATSPVVTATASLTVPIVTSVPTPTYAVGSEELAAFNLLNAERSRCGFGMLAQNAKLDVAAKAHADWLLTNGYVGHYQLPSTALFIGASPADRFVAVEYVASINSLLNVSESLSYSGSPDKVGFGVRGVRGLLNAPYHMLEMMRPDVDVGFAVRSSQDVERPKIIGKQLVFEASRKYSNFIFGVPPGLSGQTPAEQNSVRTYPCEGSAGVSASLSNEDPSPTPMRNLALSPLGTSIGIVVKEGHVLAIVKSVMKNVSTGATIELLPLDNYSTNGNRGYLLSNEGFVTANSPLEASTNYKVEIEGFDNGVTFTKTFTFTTGAAQ
jgi:uncharacterized protein YkwD